jgi:hypothetical protein
MIARSMLATSEPTLIFHPALYANKYPSSKPTMDKPKTKLAQLSSFISFNKPFSDFENINAIIVRAAAVKYVTSNDISGFTFAGTDFWQIL